MSADKHNKSRLKKNNLSFIAGIFTTLMIFAATVIILKSAGEQVGWGFQFQNPYFISFMITIVYIFGLNMLGVFTLNPPVVDSAVNALAKTGGNSKAFLEGMLATILATPCTAPFLGVALGFAFSQSRFTIFAIFGAIAFGMSLPYIIIVFFPGLTNFFPRPGKWMETIKQIMGFILLLTGIWLAAILGKLTDNSIAYPLMIYFIILGICLWVYGNFIIYYSVKIKKIIGIMCLISVMTASYYLLILGNIKKILKVVPENNSSSGTLIENGLTILKFDESKINESLQNGEPVFIEYTADWCLTCQMNKKNVLSRKKIIDMMIKNKIAYFRADWTKNDEGITESLKKYGRAGVPLYIFYKSKTNIPYIFPEIITEQMLIEKIDMNDLKFTEKK